MKKSVVCKQTMLVVVYSSRGQKKIVYIVNSLVTNYRKSGR